MPKTPNSNEKYENFVNVHLEVAAECIPTKQKVKPRVLWETLAIRKVCRHENRFFTQSEELNQYQYSET